MSEASPTSEVRYQHLLFERWKHAVAGVGGHGQGAAFDALSARYAEPHRYYHTRDHVVACLGWLDRCADAAEYPDEVELALWYHDAVYDPTRSDNEVASAELARQQLTQLGVGASAIQRIREHILATQQHRAESRDSILVIDVDLAILGAPPDVYDQFERHIRREYAYVLEKDYVVGRSRVLAEFLSRPQIYQTLTLQALLEDRARSNLSAVLQRLSAESKGTSGVS